MGFVVPCLQSPSSTSHVHILKPWLVYPGSLSSWRMISRDRIRGRSLQFINQSGLNLCHPGFVHDWAMFGEHIYKQSVYSCIFFSSIPSLDDLGTDVFVRV